MPPLTRYARYATAERASRAGPSEQSEIGAEELIKGFDEPTHEKACNIPTQKEKGRTLHFQQHWYTKFPWLHYCPQLQAVICFSCATADNQDLLKSERCEQAFISAGYKNWKKALEKFNSHQSSTSHKQAVFKLSQRDKGVNVAAQLNTQFQRQQEQNRICFLKVVSSVKYLLRQGLAFRGHTETEGNLYQLLLMQAKSDPDMQQWLRRSTSFISHECIEEIQTIFSHNILRAITADIKETQHYAVIVDGTQDIKMKEQESVCIRRVDKDLQVHEEFVGFYEPNETTGAALASTIKDALLRLGISPDDLRGQTYDGAANMAGKHNGCQAILKNDYPLCLHFRCAAHSINLVSQHACQADDFVNNALQLVQDLGTFYKRSGKFNKEFATICECLSPGSNATIKPLCPTRWLYRKVAIQSVLDNYEVVLKSLYEFGEKNKDAKALNLYDNFRSGKTLLALQIAWTVTGPLHELNRVIQGEKQTVSGLLGIAQLVDRTLKEMRTEEEFSALFENVQGKVVDLDIDPIELPRHRRPPKRFGGHCSSHRANTPEEHYRQSYYTVLDTAIQQLADRLDTSSTTGLAAYNDLESLLLNTVVEDSQIVSMYPELKEDALPVQLKMFCMNFHPKTIFDVRQALSTMSLEMRQLFTQVETLLRLLLVCPVTSCQAERSFSALRRLKTWLRNTMGQVRLNSSAICHIHKSRLDVIEIEAVAKDFAGRTDCRRKAFGRF